MEIALCCARWPEGGICHHPGWIVLPYLWHTMYCQPTFQDEHVPSLCGEHHTLTIGLQITFEFVAEMEVPIPMDVPFLGRQCVGIWPNIEANITQGHDTLDPPNIIFITVCWEGWRTLALQPPTLLYVAKV